MRKILVALDASDDRMKVGEAVRELTARWPGVEITLFHVTPPIPDDVRQQIARLDEEIGLDVNIDAALYRSAMETLQPVEEQLRERNMRVKTHIAVGDPGPELCHYAERGRYDLIVMGHRGLNRLQEAFLGSVTEYVLRNTRVPVLIVQGSRDSLKRVEGRSPVHAAV